MKRTTTTVVGAVNLIVAVLAMAAGWWQHRRFETDAEHRRTLVEIVAFEVERKAMEERPWYFGRPVADRGKIEASIREELQKRRTSALVLGAVMILASVGILTRQRWGRWLGILLGVCFILGAIYGVTQAAKTQGIVEWMTAGFLAGLALLNLIGLVGARAKAEFALRRAQ
jgi:hypothetical protein